jgi:hypothetical protein
MTAQRVQVMLDKSDAAAALRLLGAQPLVINDPFLDLDLLFGQANCAAGDPSTGLLQLRAGLAKLGNGTHDEHTPEVARFRALAGLCALSTQSREEALAYQRDAQAAFIAQPGVSAYYKAPLVELERRLGLRLPPV